MDIGNVASQKLQRIQELWTQLEHTSAKNPHYAVLLAEIRTLSAEYRALTAAPSARPRPEDHEPSS
ncbi:MAG: hypothetical protein WBF06_01430 [Candidatus Acidiferrales bacterium]